MVRSIGEVSARRYDVDLEACGLVVTVLLGLLIRLANDWELLESWSSGTDFCRCVARDPAILDGSAAIVVLVLKDAYCALVFEPSVPRCGGPTERSLDAGFRGIVFRKTGPCCDAFCWSNFFFKSFTLWFERPP